MSSIPQSGGRSLGKAFGHISVYYFNKEANYYLYSALYNHNKCLAVPIGRLFLLAYRANIYSNGDPIAKMLSTACYTKPSASTA